MKMRALRYRDFRIFWSAQFISLVGSWMQVTALSWLAYRLTHSPVQLGLIAFATQFPVFILAVGTGLLADRFNQRSILLINEGVAMAQAAILAALAVSGKITLFHIYALSAVYGIVSAVDYPVRQVFVGRLVPEEDLSAAIALNSSVLNASRIIGPTIAGILIGVAGEWLCFALNSVSYAATIGSLIAIKSRETRIRANGRTVAEVLEGLRYARLEPLKSLFLLLAMISGFGVPHLVLLPSFAEDVLHVGPKGLGVMTTFSGIGATAGALWLARFASVPAALQAVVGRAGLSFAASLALFAVSKEYLISCVALLMAGASMVVVLAGSNALLQKFVPESCRGRVISFYMLLFFGLSPVGSITAGIAARATGIPAIVAIGAVACGFASLIVSRRSILSPTYRENLFA